MVTKSIDKYLLNIIKPISKLCEPIGDDEEQAVSVTVTTDMTREEVIDKIVDLVK